MEYICYIANTNAVYKFKLKKEKTKSNAIFNLGEKFKIIGGDTWICLWFRKGIQGNEISIEYNRFNYSEVNVSEKEANGNSKGKNFCESYISLENFNDFPIYYEVFQKLIEEYNKTQLFPSREFFYKHISGVLND